MSLGKSQSHNQSQQTSNQALDPQIKDALLSNYGNQSNFAGSTPTSYGGQLVAPLNDTQYQAQRGLLGVANSGVGNNTLNSGINAAQGASTYNPNMVTAQSLPNIDLSKYMNPYLQQSLAPQLRLLNQQNTQANMANDASATSAGAFGGDRSAVQDALTNQGYALAGQTAIGNAYNTAYGNAQGAAQQDIANNLAAQTANQGAGLQGQSLNLQAGQGLAAMSAQKLGQATQLQNLIAGVGSQNQQQQQNVDTANQAQFQSSFGNKLSLQQLINQALGLAGNPTLTQAQGTGSGSGFQMSFTSPKPGG